jgi:hypothetical protein
MLCPSYRQRLLHRRETGLHSRSRWRLDLRNLWRRHPAVLQRQRLQHRPDLFGRRRRHLRVGRTS